MLLKIHQSLLPKDLIQTTETLMEIDQAHRNKQRERGLGLIELSDHMCNQLLICPRKKSMEQVPSVTENRKIQQDKRIRKLTIPRIPIMEKQQMIRLHFKSPNNLDKIWQRSIHKHL